MLGTLWLSVALAQEALEPESVEPVEEPARGDLFERAGLTPSHEADTGAPLLIPYGGFAGHVVGAAFFVVATGDEGIGQSFAAGMLGGAGGIGGSAFYTRNRSFTRDQAMLAWSAGAWGTYGGLQLARLIIPTDGRLADQRTAAATALSNVGATGLSMLFRTRAPGLEDSGLWLGAGLAGHAAGNGLGKLLALDLVEDRRQQVSLELGGAAAAGLGSWAVHRFLGVDVPGPGLTSFYAAQGAWFGFWVPFIADADGTSRQLGGSMQLGAAVGAAATMALQPLAWGHPERVVGQGVGFGLGSLVGYGVTSLWDTDPTGRGHGLGVVAGALVGEVAGGWLAHRYRQEVTSYRLTSGLGAWGLYQGIGWAIWAESKEADDTVVRGEDPSTRSGGLFTLSVGLGAAVGAALPSLVDIDRSTAAVSLSAGAWGTAYGHWVSTLAKTDPLDRQRNRLLAGDLALVAGLAGSLVRPVSVGDAWIVNGCGAAGGLMGGLIGIAASGGDRASTWGLTLGSTVGLAGGVGLAWWLEEQGTALDVSWLGPRRPGGLPSRSPFTASVLAAPYIGDDGGTGALVQLTLLEKE